MKITYIHHSGFCIETDSTAIIIDFYKDTKDVDGYIYHSVLKNKKKLYVLCTHSHFDHFNGEILNWKRKVKDITYIFSEDILSHHFAEKEEAIYLDVLGEYRDEILYIKTYGSTDAGVSFYLEFDGKKIFHAGDLNNWHWNEESSAEETAEAEAFYERELATLAQDVKELDVAMFPIDARLGKDFMKGAEQFLKTISVTNLLPMHFTEHPSKIVEFEPIAKKYNCKYIMLAENGQSINV